MQTKPRCAFLLIRSDADLARTSGNLAAYLSILHQQAPIGEFEPILGIWVDDEGLANLPRELILPGPAGKQRTVHILEATGINGIWMLCWLEAAASTISHINLVAALMECFGHKPGATPTSRFIPVLAVDSPGSSADPELQTLKACYPELVGPPIHQDIGGNLLLPRVSPSIEAATA